MKLAKTLHGYTTVYTQLKQFMNKQQVVKSNMQSATTWCYYGLGKIE